MKISIIITLYNYADYIQDCLASINAQTCRDFEVIVVDDYSTDGGTNKAASYISGYKMNGWVEVLPSNMGEAYARNTGVRLAKGEYLVFVDADDILTKDSLEIRLVEFEKNPKLDFVHGIALRWYGGDDTRGHSDTYCHAQGRMYRRNLHERFGLYYNMRSMNDKEWTYRLGIHPESPLPKLVKEKKSMKILGALRDFWLQLKTVLPTKLKIG